MSGHRICYVNIMLVNVIATLSYRCLFLILIGSTVFERGTYFAALNVQKSVKFSLCKLIPHFQLIANETYDKQQFKSYRNEESIIKSLDLKCQEGQRIQIESLAEVLHMINSDEYIKKMSQQQYLDLQQHTTDISWHIDNHLYSNRSYSADVAGCRDRYTMLIL